MNTRWDVYVDRQAEKQVERHTHTHTHTHTHRKTLTEMNDKYEVKMLLTEY